MQQYFWMAELDNHEDNKLCFSDYGIVDAKEATEGLQLASRNARLALGPKGSFTIKQFNKVS